MNPFRWHDRLGTLGRTWALGLVVILALSASVRGEPLGPSNSWPFEPKEDRFNPNALLDLRSLNEKQSGETGFIKLSPDGNSFVRGDGAPIRFWACGTDVYQRSPQEIGRHCRFLAKMGVNMARLHTTVANTKEGSKITDVDEKTIEGIFRFIKSAKENGIYVTISPYYGHHNTPKSWQLEGFAADKMPWGALFIDPHMQEGYKAWTKALYTRVNPHTKLAIKDDPTVAILQIHNEDSLFFWTMQALPEPQQAKLAKYFAEWLQKKYGSLEKASAAWDRHQEEGDDLAKGKVALLSTWHMTQDFPGGIAKRLRDQVRFEAEHQREFYASMGRYLREELGCKQLLNATNWRTANDRRLKDIERWTYAALDIDAENEYYGSDYQHIGENNGYRIDPGHHFVDESCLHKPLELTANFKQHIGHPFIVTETSWKHPNLYQSEGPFLIAAYQSIGGVDAVFWFSATDPTWLTDPRRMFWKVGNSHALDKWSCSTPMLMGMFPANALLFRNGYLKEPDPIVHEVRALEDLWERKPAAVDDNEIYGVSRNTEECSKVRSADGSVSRAAFLVGPVQVSYAESASRADVEDFARFLEPAKSLVRSATRELAWEYKTGLCLMNAPCAQGITGFLKAGGGSFELADVAIDSKNDYATVNVVSMDGQPIATSGKLLVQVGTTCRLTGWEEKEVQFPFQKTTIDGKEIVNSGSPPWRIANTQMTLTVRNPNLKEAVLLDVQGYTRRKVPVKRAGGNLSVALPTDTMYLVLQ